jgi:ATP-binding cassette subfamily B (MDR/TAP) protein 7
MLIPPLARAAHRPGVRTLGLSLRLSPNHATRVFTTSPLHRKDAHGQRPTPGSKVAVEETKAAKPANTPAVVKATKVDPLENDQMLSNKEQRKADWAIMKEMSAYLWPKDNLGTRLRVGLSVGLLVGAKLLNVQVPFYFKSIVDSMNIDFVAVGGTAWTVAGSMILACKLYLMKHLNFTETTPRWRDSHGRSSVAGTPQCRLRECSTEGDKKSRLRRL